MAKHATNPYSPAQQATTAGSSTSAAKSAAPSARTDKRRPGRPTIGPGKKRWIQRLHKQGMTQREIARKLDLAVDTVRKYLHHYKLIEDQRPSKTVAEKQQPRPKTMAACATVTYVSRPWYRRVLDWFRG